MLGNDATERLSSLSMSLLPILVLLPGGVALLMRSVLLSPKLGVVANQCGAVAKIGVVFTKRGVITELGFVAKRCGVVAEIGVFAEHVIAMLGNDATKRGVVPAGDVVPKRGVIANVVTKHAPSGVALFSRLASLPERGVVIIVAAINDGVTTKRCFVGVGLASRGT